MRAFKDFRDFILRGNVVDLAVGIVIGIAFGSVVTAFVKDIITPIIAIPGKTDFSAFYFTINHSTFLIGDFLNVLFAFIVIAAVIFFFVVRPMNSLLSRVKKAPPLDAAEKACPYCLSTIPMQATRCAYCTQEVAVPVTVSETDLR